MKKLFIMLAATCCLMFTACNNKPAEQPAEATEPQTEAPCCEEMTEEQKAEMEACKKAAEDWQNWENLTDERKAAFDNGCCGGCCKKDAKPCCKGEKPGCKGEGHGCKGEGKGCPKEGGKCPKGN